MCRPSMERGNKEEEITEVAVRRTSSRDVRGVDAQNGGRVCVPPVLHQPAWTIDAYLNNSPLKSAKFRRQTIHACPPVVSMLVLWTPFESSQALSAVFRRAKRHESKRRTYEFRATIPYASAWMDPSFTMQCGGVL